MLNLEEDRDIEICQRKRVRPSQNFVYQNE